MIVLRTVRDRRARERMHACITGFAAMSALTGLIFLAACTFCPPGSACPRIPISLPAQP